LIVGVFVNEEVDEVNRIAAYCNLDWIQLSGNEKQEYCLKIERPLIKVIHMSSDKTPELITSEIYNNYSLLENNKLVFLLDTHSSLTYGGTGKLFNWDLLKRISPKYPMFIAGGLTPGNVSELVKNIKPWGVDVSSGVETDGKKDSIKIKAFIEAVKKFPAER
jgi:phosphoribosylanthranilate isomerase